MDVLEFADADAWDAWLQEHHDTETEAFVRIRRKSVDLPLIAFEDALDTALCHGWIDSIGRRLDDVSTLQRFSPRRPTSAWSRVNVAKIEQLEAQGRLRAGGIAQVEAARADGRWAAAYPPQSAGEVPPELAAALDASPVARAAFDALRRSDQYAIELPIFKSRSPESRTRLAARAVERLSRPSGPASAE